ncbi:MAG TPA: general secretion pathway protein [Nitrospiraceae bacterium]|nr:general secretion pathway protein [Nitrospiraceae bacterium]
MDYLEFFDLKENPFRLTPDPFYFYPSGSHNEALSSFNYIVEQKEGFFMCTGEPGTGKTTLLNTFLNTDRWKDRAGIALVLTPRLSPEEFLLTVLEDLNVKVKNTNKNEIIRAFRDFLIENSMFGRRIIIIVDEAQNLPDETLEELRLLSNLETEKEKLLQIVLIGQPELRSRLFSENLKQLNQRITVRTTLMPLTINEASDYINYRLVKAGKGNVVFEDRAKRFIHKLSKGIPRLINLICSRAMMAAYLDMSRQVKKRHVEYAIRHISDVAMPVVKRRKVLKASLLAALLITAFAIAIIMNYDLHITPVADSTHRADRQDAVVKEPPKVDAVNTDKLPGPGIDITARQKTLIVVADTANLRTEPSINAETVTPASKGKVFEITDEFTEIGGRKWYKVKTSEGKEGWIADKAVRLEQGTVPELRAKP